LKRRIPILGLYGGALESVVLTAFAVEKYKDIDEAVNI